MDPAQNVGTYIAPRMRGSLPLQILWMNLVTDVFPALGFAGARFAPLVELSSTEEAKGWLEVALNRASFDAVAALSSS